MKDISSGYFYGKLCNKKEHYPWSGQIELTYRCNLNCIHCYCKGSEARSQNSLNGDTTPCNYRLSPEELLEVKKSDPEIWEEYKRGLCGKFPDLGRDREFVYHCTAWLNQFFINPYGRLKFCQFSDKFSVDLRKQTFKEGFYNVFPQLLNEKFKTDSKCKDCSLRPICYHCPARAYLEAGNEEVPVEYYCRLAEENAKQMHNCL